MRQFQESIRRYEGIPASLQSSWERRLQSWEHLGAPATKLGGPATCLEAPRITVERSGKNNIVFGNGAGARLEIIATTYRSTIWKTHVLSLYSHLSIYVSMYIATHLHTV
jgi:hypothetical protein